MIIPHFVRLVRRSVVPVALAVTGMACWSTTDPNASATGGGKTIV